MRGWHVALVAGCAAETPPDEAGVPSCEAAMAATAPIAGLEDVASVLDAVRRERFPELDGVTVVLGTIVQDGDTFVSDVEVATIGQPPRDRTYRVRANPEMLLPDPPPPAGVYAILAHELKHVVDYTGMDTDAFVAWALDYATGPITAYERATDEHVLRLGCGSGLAAFRTWLYERVDEETEAEKRRDYYTPEEIAAWEAAHGG